MIIASVIIPNWNGVSLLPNCIKSLNSQSVKYFEIIVVDNGSKDESVKYLSEFSNIKVITLKKNYGFSKAINEGAKIAQGKYLLFLNNDTEVDKDWVKELVDFARNYTNLASINSKILNFDSREKIDGVGITIDDVGHAKSIGYNEVDKGQFSNPFYILGATGGGSLFSKEIFFKVGMFDESYFMYSEEVDYAFRAQFLGYKSIYCPKAVVYHRHKATSGKNKSKVEYWQFRNMTQTIIKDFTNQFLLKDFRWLKIILIHLNTIFYQLRNGYFWPPVLTELWLIVNLPRLLIARIKIQSNIKVSGAYVDCFFTEKKIFNRFLNR